MLNNTINKDEVKTEIRTAVKEAAVELVGRFFDNLFTDSKSEQPPELTVNRVNGADKKPPEPEYPGNFLAVVAGYLYMSLKESGCETVDLRGVMQKLELNVKTFGCDEAAEAYKECERELLPVVVEGVAIPPKYEELAISELKFANRRMCARLTNALRIKNIVYIKDFRDHDADVSKIRNLGAGSLEQFKAALNRTIGNETDEIPESKKPQGKKFEVISTSERDEPQAGGLEIGGVTIPKNCLNKRVDSLKFTSNVSRTKTLNNLKKHNIVCLKDFFNRNTPALYKIFSYRGKLSFIKTLKRSL